VEAQDGQWQLLDSTQAWDGNSTWDCFICSAWSASSGRLIIAANYAPNQSQCRVQLPLEDIRGRTIRLQDLMGPAVYERDGNELLSQGLYLDMPAWGYHVFRMTAI
jgi:hypothetical protein